jgi:hypothetical protein
MADWSSDGEQADDSPSFRPPPSPSPPPSAPSTVLSSLAFRPPSPPPSKSVPRKTKRRAIFTKEMMGNLPRLRWLPGDFYQFRWADPDPPFIPRFCESAALFDIISIMIYCENVPVYRLSLFTLSTPLITILFDLSVCYSSGRGGVRLPPALTELLARPNLTVVCPGDNDWFSGAGDDHLLMLRDLLSELPNFHRLKKIKEFEETLFIQPSGPQLCSHLKMMRWIFQLVIESQLHGMKQQSAILPVQWKTLTDHYGKMLIFLFWALEQKQERFDRSPEKGLCLEPIYLEDLLIEYGIVRNMDKDALRKQLIGTIPYPNPPLPRLPSAPP